ncbi:LysM peptidoglycan-binding domain-containing protein [Ligilactobacillus ceti]|uniref:Cell wall-associated hydrolase n=1 Tax=Ligilactobacillus ceti DSM 22408 TaxID=1122146 RepID=A0A0R2KTC6_9LACO|nr:LysM peptidoglycan-binding domain-containing protein [Ligilactobacillus ceti]KRN89543.1 hypothetical protein IV53_GL001221 [Ligilactobacillus ceti DSM 22408]
MNLKAKSLLIGSVGAAGLFLASAQNANADTLVKVNKNDTVWDFSQKYDVSIDSIEQANNIDQNTHIIITGQTLTIPSKDAATAPVASEKTTSVTVKAGDSLWALAKDYGTTVNDLRALNNMGADESLIKIGQTLQINGTVQTTPVAPAATTPVKEEVVQKEAAKPAPTVTPAQKEAPAKVAPAKVAPATKEAAPVVAANHVNYVVKSGDSLYNIAQDYGVTVASLREANKLGPTLQIGEKLVVNNPTKTPQKAAPAKKVQPKAQTVTPAARPAQPAKKAAVKPAVQPARHTTANGQAVVSIAQRYLGVPYVWAGESPAGFDCSGLVKYVFKQVGVNLPHYTVSQEGHGRYIDWRQAQPGDLYFWGSRGGSYHVAIATGNGNYIHAPQPGESVKYGSTRYFQPSFAIRVF